ncbi:LOW QUALITY PROTEIN: jouberin [Rhinatrema bivittatum]|uniref:LOW QUALITY PROTEIN: jouberin n=1 Tax=Rhinatrema bivittatum TaxID=194408 RepID=UPI00112E6B41|nr:LOW QUALITY PROTEIN: jouberin [Rhinatrema bivittatum]
MPAGESEAKAKTKARFEEVYRSYAGRPAEKKKSKKSSSHQEQIVLETLRNQLDLVKETENDEAIINNTYHPEASPRFTKNKLRDRAAVAEKVNNDVKSEGNKQGKAAKKKQKAVMEEETAFPALTGEADEIQRVKADQDDPQQQRDKKRRARSALKSEQTLAGDQEEEQLIHACELRVSEEEVTAIREKIKKKLKEQMAELTSSAQSQRVPLNNEASRKKAKKKEIPLATEAETSAMSISELQSEPAEEHTIPKQKSADRGLSLDRVQEDGKNAEEPKTEETVEQPKSKVKKVKKRPKKEDTATPGEENSLETTPGRTSYVLDDTLILGVNIHRTDKLKTDLMVSHPMVKIHVIDERTGLYVKKETSNRAVSSFYEQEKVEHVLPIMTQPYDFKRFKSTLPDWEEQILFNERFNYFLQETEESPRVILFFEVLDFLSMDEAKSNSEVQMQERGFRKIAWAFLKLVGANGVRNVDGKLRLQLYYPPARFRAHQNAVDVFEWWMKYPRNRYPSTLYVTIKGLKLPDHIDPSSRSMMALQKEQSNTSYGDLQSEAVLKDNQSTPDAKKVELIKWTRLPGQACRIPNKHLLSLRTGHMGCFCVDFSHDGRTLAAACADRDGYPIFLYDIPSGRYLRELHGHLNIVYDLCWSKDDRQLLTSSSDGTVRMWQVEPQGTSALKVIPHPSFVYTAKYHPVAVHLVVTGCYDSVIRVWNVKVKEAHGCLLQEFDGHRSFVNTLCFDAEGFHMFSGDSSGLIIVWNTFVNGSSQQHPVQHWGIKKEIQESDMKGISVNHLEVHPNGRRLLIHAKDSTLRVLDLRILATKKYIGATNYREKIHSTITPCGTFLFSGSEDGMAYVWNAETGDQVAKYPDLSYTSPLRDVAFHPHEHMVAFCAFGESQPIIVYIYDHKVAQLEAEIVKDFGGSLTSSVPRRPDVHSSFDITSQHDPSLSSADQFVSAVKTSMRMQKVKQKLDSVMNSGHLNTSRTGNLYDQPGYPPSMTWSLSRESRSASPINSGYPYPAGSNLLLPAPSVLSPHSKLRLPGTLGTQLIPQHAATTRGSFSPVGQPLNRMPSVRLQMCDADPSTSLLKIEADGLMPVQESVVALYDYTAHRSDELTIHRSDIIQVLYKDNDSWWFGCLANGQQGYFPANYVAGGTQSEEQSPSVVPDYSPLLANEQTEAEEVFPPHQRMSAAISKSGNQKCTSQPNTDADSPLTQGARKKKKTPQRMELDLDSHGTSLCTSEAFGNAGGIQNEPGMPNHGTEFKKKSKRITRQAAIVGTTNDAFEPDCSEG